MELNDLIAAYKAAREERERFEAFYKGKLADLSKQIEIALDEAGLKSAKTEAGQAITSQRRTVKVGDWDTFEPFARTYYPELIKKSIDTTEALRLIDDDVVMPGVEVSSTFVLSVK